MKEYRKEIIICFIALATAGWAIWYFTRSLQQEKEVDRIDLYSIVASDASCFLQINRPALLNYILADYPSLANTTASYIPPFFINLLQEELHSSPLLSFHPGGMLFYMAITEKERKEIENKILSSRFGLYTPQTYEKYGIHFLYYPDTENRFLGYFYSNGIWVASYSRKLLEEVARKIITGNNSFPDTARSLMKSLDPLTPVNILFNNERWGLTGQWIGGDLFISEGNLCFFSSFPYSTVSPQWADTFFSTFTNELNQFSGLLFPDPAIQTEGDCFLYTICSFTKEKEN